MKVSLRGVDARHIAAPRGGPAALRGVDLALAAGEQVAVIGPSGAGKTTLLHVAAAALRPEAGAVALDDADPWRLPTGDLQRLRGRLFLAPQTPPLPPRQRVVTAVLAAKLPAMGLAASLRSLFYPSDIAGAHAALVRFNLGDKIFDRVDRLSGGERQRVGLARALLAPARLWLIDEPLSALDPARAAQALATLIAESRARGVTLLASMHQVDITLASFPRIVGLREGQVTFDLPAAEVTRAHLLKLYASHEDELEGGPAPHVFDPPPLAGPPVGMQCR